MEPWYLTGATASGKSAVAIELARTLDAEIVSMDSMAVFRGMDIGTAKSSLADRAAVPHQLIDVVDPYDDFSLADYLALAGNVSAEIQDRGKQVLFVGGTPLYLKALLRGVFEGPPADWQLRSQLHEAAERDGPESLHRRLAEVDLLTAGRLHVQDVRRVVRALEVFEKTGQSITVLQQEFDRARPAEACKVFVLDWPRAELVRRIEARVDAMFAAGWIDEVRQLLNSAQPLSRTASQAVGYREIIEHLRGERSLAETVELVKARTRQFAKRQLTWFRSLSECRWLPMSEPADPHAIAAQIVQATTPS